MSSDDEVPPPEKEPADKADEPVRRPTRRRDVVIVPPELKASRLAALGLPEQILVEAVHRGRAARNNCTANDVQTRAGYELWAETTRQLRDLLAPEGDWNVFRENGLEYTRNLRLGVRVVVSAGDHATGDTLRSPSNRRAKGVATKAAVASAWLFAEEWRRPTGRGAKLVDFRPPNLSRSKERLFVLLVDPEGGVELSRPASIGSDGFISAWLERIILADESDKGGGGAKRLPDGSGEFRVDVEPRLG